MSYNHPLWAQQDLAAARQACSSGSRRRPRPARRRRRPARSASSIEVARRAVRRRRQAGARHRLRRRAEEAPREVSGRRRDRAASTRWRCSAPARPGVSNTRNAMQAAAISQEIFQRNPKHPGAAHYIIHSFDDPDHAILSLHRRARLLEDRAVGGARAAHAVAHLRPARHVGRRRRVEHRGLQGRGRSRRREEPAARPRGLPHAVVAAVRATCSRASSTRRRSACDQAKAVADKDTAPNVRDGYASMKARQVVETAKWEKLALPTGAVKDGGAPGYDGSAAYVLAAGAERGASSATSRPRNVALDKLKAMRTQAESGSNAYRAKPFAIMEKEVGAALAVGAEGHGERRDAAQGSDRDRADARRAVGAGRADQAVVRAVRRAAARARTRRRKPRRSSSSRSSGCRTAAPRSKGFGRPRRPGRRKLNADARRSADCGLRIAE